MAEHVLVAFLSMITEKLASGPLMKYARSIGIHSDLKKWYTFLSYIQSLLQEYKKEQNDESVKLWLNRLQHLAYDIDDILDALATEEAMQREVTEEESRPITSKVTNLLNCCTNNFSLTTRRMHQEFVEVNSKLHDLENETVTIGLINVTHETPRETSNRIKESSLLPPIIVGREGEKMALLPKLLGNEPCKENFSIVPVVGMGGVGKTTLAKLLYNDQKVKDRFDLRAWVCVSDEFDVFDISQAIYENVSHEHKMFKDLRLLQVALSEKLKNKRFLIVLDDLWSASNDDWKMLVHPFHSGARGSKIIITTQHEKLLQNLGCDQCDRVWSLLPNDALSLFTQHALGKDNFDSHPTLKPYGLGIVKKCGGLPLALIALGRLLKTKTDKEDWEDVLNNEIWESHNGAKIFLALRLSYIDLPAPLKQLVAYSSLFPKDYLFDKEEVVLLWMAEGFLRQSTFKKSMEQLGSEYFDELVSRSFFQQAPNDQSLYMMHDLVNDLATSVAGEFFSRLDIEKGKEFMKYARENFRHMSFVREVSNSYKKFELFKGARKLRSFLALSYEVKESWRTFYLSDKILADLLHELQLLRVLSLSHLSIEEVPEFIGSLKLLRYLNLSRTRIRHVPENVGSLSNLQTLIVSGCRSLTRLPNSFLRLKNLRHLDIRDTLLLKKMPVGIIELKRLRIRASHIGGDNLFAVTKFQELLDLQGILSIEGLEKVQNVEHAQKVKLSQKMISELDLSWSYRQGREPSEETKVLNVLMPGNARLKKLSIRFYGGTEFPEWVGDPLFLHLADVRIDGCEKCTRLPPLGQLPKLKKLWIGSMDEVKTVGLELVGSNVGRAFPSLESLSFVSMKGWERWSTDTDNRVFPCLKELHMSNCPKLVEIRVGALLPHSLRVVEVKGCGHGVLTSLVRAASPSVTRLDIESVSGLTNEVWGGVMERLGVVEELSLKRCNEIRYMWESEAEASKVLLKLRELKIENCYNLVRLGKKEDDGNSVSGSNLLLTSLKKLSVGYCPRMERCSFPNSVATLEISGCHNLERCKCPDSIESLSIYGCDSITSVSFPSGGGWQKLKYYDVDNCNKLVLQKELGGADQQQFICEVTIIN